MLMPVNACTFPNIGWLEVDTPDACRQLIEKEIEKPGDDYRRELAGHTAGAYLLPKLSSNLDFESWFISLAATYDDTFPAYANTICHHKGSLDLRLDDVWVNHHTRCDFNPMHWHGGVYSFVTWIKVPYTLEEEAKRFETNNPQPGQFAFTVTDSLGEIHDHIIPQREWTTLFFPARMRHKVHPYYSTDEVRVSISGNLSLM